jgi:hypothetical protein
VTRNATVKWVSDGLVDRRTYFQANLLKLAWMAACAAMTTKRDVMASAGVDGLGG